MSDELTVDEWNRLAEAQEMSLDQYQEAFAIAAECVFADKDYRNARNSGRRSMVKAASERRRRARQAWTSLGIIDSRSVFDRALGDED
jgi:hypothetical protein